ncbi:cardiomyopathy-associated protein 5 isoform X2 [Sphaerodactylus townsendi]|uniref:cardiomyopathy-associated protein 5 isoform X2 n=1 Tax=Sphaerodactylus townsendi TaxID=933632 RepID=UPI0020275D9B|nr:cardiomyopathy-associated protein 5 isoform X2 [Sphaerodactylus townsendi]
MDTDCNLEYDESPDISVEGEEEDEDEPQERNPLSNSLKNFNRNSGRRKTMSPDTIDTVQSEDNGLTWETSSSRCSTSQASETSATSGVYSMDNSYVDSPPGRVMDEGKAAQKTNSSLDQMPSFPNQNSGMDSKEFSIKHNQVTAQRRELDPADPHSWPLQVQPSKIKDYLIQITQEVESVVSEEKENALKKKGELPIKGTVRARIEQITAVLEERNKRIFRRANEKDLPSGGTRKPKEQPKIFPRQGISVSLRHVERDTRDKNNKKEIIRYNLKPVQTNISKSGVSTSYKKDEKKMRKSVLPDALNKTSEKPSPILSPLANKANKLDNNSYSPLTQTSASEHAELAPPGDQDAVEIKAKPPFLPDVASVMSEKSFSSVEEPGKPMSEHRIPGATGVPCTSDAPEGQTAQLDSPISAGPLSHSANEEGNQAESAPVVSSESAAWDVKYQNVRQPETVQHEHEPSLLAENASRDIELHPSELESKGLALLCSTEETGKQIIPSYSPAESLPEEAEDAPHSVTETEKKERKQLEVEYLKTEDAQKQPGAMLPTEPNHLPVPPSAEESVTREAEKVSAFSSIGLSTEKQECLSGEEHFRLPELSCLMGEAEKKEQVELNLDKQGIQTQASATALQEPEFQDVSYSRDKEETQTVQLEFQHLDTSLPFLTAERKVHQDSESIIQSENEQPVISEVRKVVQGSGDVEPSHLRDVEVSPHLSIEKSNETAEQLPSVSSLLTDIAEKKETQSPSPAVLQSEQPNSVVSYVTEQIEKQDNLLCTPEKTILISEVPLPTVAVQNADMTKLDIQPDSTTKTSSKELVSISRESAAAAAAAEEKTIWPDLPLSAEPPPKASVQLHEAADLENHNPPSVKANLYSEDQDASLSHSRDDSQQEVHHLFGTAQLETKHSVTPEIKKQNTNESTQSQLEMEAIVALSSADEADTKIMENSFTEPSHPDSLDVVHVPEKEETVQVETGQTPQRLPSTSLQKVESNVSQSVEETVINGIQVCLPATAKDSSESICSTELQDNGDFSTGLAAPDSGLLNIQNSTAQAMARDITASKSGHVAKQPRQAATAELEPDYVSSMPESRMHLDTSFPVMNAEEGDRGVTPWSDHEGLILSEAEGKVTEHDSAITPASSAAPESQEIQSCSSNEASEKSQKISSLSLGDTKSLENSVPAPGQSDFLLSDHNNKPQKEENQCLLPQKSESVPEEQLSLAAFLMGECREQTLHLSRAVKIAPEESKFIPEDVTSEAVKEIAPSFSPVPEEHISKETFSSFVVDGGEEQSNHLTAEKADVQDDQSHLFATAQFERRNKDVELYCPVTAPSELEDRTALNTTEEISKQEMPQNLFSAVQPAPTRQGLLHCTEKRDNQESTPLASLQSPVLQKEAEHVDLLPPIKEQKMEVIQPYSSAAVQDLCQPLGYLPDNAEVDFGVSKSSESMDEAEKKEIQPPKYEAEKLEYKQPASSLLTEIVGKHGVCSYSPEASIPAVLGQANFALMDFTEEAKKPEVQPCSPETVVPEEPLSIAAFLLSEAKEMQTFFPKTVEKESLDVQLPFEEPNLLIEGSTNGSASPSEIDEAIKREIQPSATYFETEQLSHEFQAEAIDQNRENICNSPTISNLILNESSDTVLSEHMRDTQLGSANSDKTSNKAILISSETVSGTEDIKNLPHTDITWKQTENYLEKEKELKDNEKPRQKAIATPELDQGKNASMNSEYHETVNIHVPPPVPAVDKEDMHIPEKVKYLEAVSFPKTQPFHLVEDLVADQKPLMHKLGSKTSESLKIDNFENKENELKGLVKEKDVQGSIKNEKEKLTIPENKNDGIVNVTGLDNFGKDTLTDDSSFTQTGKEQSVQVVQGPLKETKENAEKSTPPAASLENILEFSLLESKMDETFHGVEKKENATTIHQDIPKVLNRDKQVDVVRTNDKNKEEINLVGAFLFHAENDTLSQTPLIPLPDETVNPELIAGQPALASWNRDLCEKEEMESEEDSYKHLSDENIKDTDVPLHGEHGAPDDEITVFFQRGSPKHGSPNNLEDSKREQVLKHQNVTDEPPVLQDAYESNEKECESVYIPSKVTEMVNDALIDEPAEIISDVKVQICLPTHAIPFGSRFYHSGATSDDGSQNRVEESSSSETSQMLPEETSDEESCPILDYAATVYQKESSVQDESTCLVTDQTQQSEITEVDKVDNDVAREPLEEGALFPETFHHEGQLEQHSVEGPEPVAQGVYALDHEHLPSWDFEGQTYEKRVNENISSDLVKLNRDDTNQQLSASEAKSDKVFGELDFSLLSHDFESYSLYPIKEEEYSDDEDLAELMGYETVTRDDVFQEETVSELACEELLFDDRKSLDRISDGYEFINEKEASTYTEEGELMGLEKLPEKVPESEVPQRETELAQLDTYCSECKCLISANDKLWGEHKDHSVANLDTGVIELKGQLDGFLDILQERSLKIEGYVSEIEALFNTLEDNCKGKEQLLEEQHENIVKTVLGHHDQKAQRFEEIKNTKMEYLYEQMVTFQEYIDTAKENLETIVKETEEMDDFVFLRSSEEINKRLLSAVEDIQTLEKIPTAFSHFEHFAGNSASGNWALEHMSVPQTPKLQPQEPNSATSTSIAVYWTVSEDDVIDFFQVYCMEEHQGRQEQSGLVEEYRVTVKESNCILEDLEPGHSYNVWIMAVNYAGCSFPSEKSTFRTAPPTPVMKAEDCTVCWDTATIRWCTGHSEATDSFTLEYCRQYSPEGEGLRSLAGIKRTELKVNLEPNINYFFYVRAVNVFGMSEQSEAALVSTKGTRFHIMKETAHPALQVSPSGTIICLPKETQTIGISPVLGELLSSRGWHYWEVTVTGSETYKIGICYSGVPPDSTLGQNNSSWCLYCSSKTSLIYTVLHNSKMSDVIVTEHPARIGILLDYNTGRLLFFNAERGQCLFAIRQKFTASAHPVFGLEQPGILQLHTGMELPEFVKNS